MMPTAINWIFPKCSCSSWSSSTEESALRSALDSLNDCGSSLHASLHFWTWVVVVGVALEVFSVVWEYCEELHDFNRGFVHPPERPIRLLFAVGLLGAVMVAFGVTGEVIAESRIETLETCIRKGNEALYLLLSHEAQSAQQSADGASASAKAADLAAGKAQAKAKSVEKQADSIALNLAITSQLLSAPTLQNRDDLIAELKKFKVDQVFVRSYIGDGQDWPLCSLIVDIAGKADMHPVDECSKAPPTITPIYGVQVQGPDDTVMMGVANALSRIGRIGVGSGPYGKAPHSAALVIFLGEKSPITLGPAPTTMFSPAVKKKTAKKP